MPLFLGVIFDPGPLWSPTPASARFYALVVGRDLRRRVRGRVRGFYALVVGRDLRRWCLNNNRHYGNRFCTPVFGRDLQPRDVEEISKHESTIYVPSFLRGIGDLSSRKQ